MNRERVEHAIEVLKQVSADRFNLGSWATFGESEWATIGDGKPVRINGCGMTACACGWIASSPKANEEGFHMVMGGCSHPDVNGDTVYESNVVYGNLYSWDAVESYFDIGLGVSGYLFSERRYHDGAGPLDVVERLQYMLEHGEQAMVEHFYRQQDGGE